MTVQEFWDKRAELYMIDGVKELPEYQALSAERAALLERVSDVKRRIDGTAQELGALIDDGNVKTLKKRRELSERLEELRYELDTGAARELERFDAEMPERVAQIRRDYRAAHTDELIKLAERFEAAHGKFLEESHAVFSRWNAIVATCGNSMQGYVLNPEHIPHLGLFAPMRAVMDMEINRLKTP